MSAELLRMDATDQAAGIARGDFTAETLLEACLARIEACNPQLGAVVHRLDEKAHASLDSLPEGPFAGVPMLVKDAVCRTAGDPYHAGSRYLKNAGYVATVDSELARRFRAAGFVIVGRSNTPEFATSFTTESLAHGPARNPWNLAHSSGGSSGGSAAAVAAGLVSVAHANDMGGSIRGPASFCGLVGLKPTRARTSLAPLYGEHWGPLTHEHVLTRSVRDCAAVLDAIAGPAPGDPYTAPAPARPYAQEVGAPPGGLRIGVVGGASHDFAVSDDCLEGVRRTAALLESLGHRVEEVEIPELHSADLGRGMVAVMSNAVALDIERWQAELGRPPEDDEIEPLNRLFWEMGRVQTGTAYVEGVEALHRYGRGLAPFFHGSARDAEGFDLLVTPTVTAPPPQIGELSPDVEARTLLARLGQLTPYTTPFDATGQPAISLPMHWSEEGLPIGVQLVARYGREDVLFRVAAQLEEAQPWRDRHPPDPATRNLP